MQSDAEFCGFVASKGDLSSDSSVIELTAVCLSIVARCHDD